MSMTNRDDLQIGISGNQTASLPSALKGANRTGTDPYVSKHKAASAQKETEKGFAK